MKNQRHQKILELINAYPIERQEDLLTRLRESGFEVTQATVSRDIRQLRLVKAATGDGHYRYTTPAGQHGRGTSPAVLRRSSARAPFRSRAPAHIVMVKCHSGMASAACEVFDLVTWEDVVGSLAGENTFIILMRSEEAASRLVVELSKYVK